MIRTVSRSKFKARPLEYFRKGERTGQELVVTDRGRPVLKIVPYRPDPEEALKVLRDTVKRSRGRLELTMDVADWVARSESLPFVHFVPVDNQIAFRATQLPGQLHSDPTDRIIISTTQILGARLVTRDERLWKYPHVETVW